MPVMPPLLVDARLIGGTYVPVSANRLTLPLPSVPNSSVAVCPVAKVQAMVPEPVIGPPMHESSDAGAEKLTLVTLPEPEPAGTAHTPSARRNSVVGLVQVLLVLNSVMMSEDAAFVVM